jgi:hypothetical protein
MMQSYLILLVAVIAQSACANAQITPQMEAFRTNMPAPQGILEMNGFGLTDIKGDYYLWYHLSGVARRMRVDGKEDLIALMLYLKDPDQKIRCVAAQALEQRLPATRNRMAMDDIENIHSKGHAKMVEAFAKKLAEPNRCSRQP